MKKILFAVALLISGFVFQTASAQVRFSVNIRLQPVWGPVGYDHVDYYYMPDIDVFYYVPRHQYIYQERGRWRFSTTLPSRYRSFDFYSGYKVVINDDPRPYQNAATYRSKYAPYKGRHDQQIIRNSNDQKYWEIKDHPKHNQWKQNSNQKNRGQNRRKG